MSAVRGADDLVDLVNWTATECLNESPQHTLQNALKAGYREDAKLLLESDTDEQLLIHINYNSPAKLQAITITGPADGHAPRHVKLFINRPTIGFSEAAEEACVQSFQLSEANLRGEAVQLRLAKFQGVNSLSIFIEDNQGDEEVTKVQKIQVAGTAGETMNVGDIKKSEEG